MGGGGSLCPVGLRIPPSYRGSADIAFGRAARPHEQYESTGLVTAPDEALHGLRFKGITVACVLALLRSRHVTVAQYRSRSRNGARGIRADEVPGAWRVDGADPWAPGQVLLWVSPRVSRFS
jgi:hypothetical protein